MLDPDRILQASRCIDTVFQSSPQYLTDRLLPDASVRVLLKIESLNPIGSFKGRGASWWLQCQRDAGRSVNRVVCASAGNFGQGIAYVARNEVAVDVFAARGANPQKLAAMEGLGARVHLCGEDFDAAKARAAEYAGEHGYPYIEDGLDDEIAEGAGTIAAELLRHADPIDVIYLPVGNGALVNGVGAYFRRHSAKTRIVGVCAAGAPSMERSWRAGRAIETATVSTLADGVAARVPIQRALDLMTEVVDEMMLVEDEQIVKAMRLLFERENLVAEAAGAVSLAGLLADADNHSGRVVAVLVSGGNINPTDRSRLVHGT